MLLACSVDTPIHINRFHFLCVAWRVLCGLGLRGLVHIRGLVEMGKRKQRVHDLLTLCSGKGALLERFEVQ